MKKKVLLFILCFFLVTGCDVKYDLTINNDSYDETITLSFLKSQNTYEDVSSYLEDKIPISYNSSERLYYNSKIEEDDNYYNLVYNYKHNTNTFMQSYFVSNCYPNFNIESNDEQIILSSGQQFACFVGDDGLSADSVEINITTKLKVLENNADEINGNTYTWNIDESNYNNKPIEMTLQKSFEIEDVVPQNEASNLSFIIVVAIIVVALVVFVFVKHKARKNNNI